MRRAPRHWAIVFENNIREQQTSVERTGVAAGPHPRAPGAPARMCWAPQGVMSLGEVDLARRDPRNE
jgi:hypothetical protein